MRNAQKLFQWLLILFACNPAYAQDTWPSPEVAQMYRHAISYMDNGNFKDAVTTFKQAILLAPDKMVLYRDMGRAQYLSGDYAEAEKSISSFLSMHEPAADAQCYQLLAASGAALGKYKDARKAIKEGLVRFPDSGILYRELGNIYHKEKKQDAALNAWIDGIEKAPAYSGNYYEAARVYLATDNVLWGLLYGEIYLCMERDTTGAQELKRLLFSGYKTMFDNIAKLPAAKDGNVFKSATVNGFEAAVMNTYVSLTPVVSDGITTENLTMVRTRFLMDWFLAYAKKYPFSLFSYEDEMVRTGHFDIDNEWLFGKAERAEQFEAWNKFHDGDLDRFMSWQRVHPLKTNANEHYNARKMKGMFGGKKKR
jgi:tetratricopeptide (TPR) repeat protein